MPSCIPPIPEPFDHDGFWQKLLAFLKRAGYPFIETCLQLYYTSQKEGLPLWAKVIIYSALAYFISLSDQDKLVTLRQGDWVCLANPRASYGYLYLDVYRQESGSVPATEA